ncbi:unnamed protein product, partial [Closterium sp. NIES-54]
DQGVDQFTPASQRVTHCTCARTGRHLATFTRRPGSSLYTLSTESPPVPASGKVAASSQVFAAASGSCPESAPCSCRLLSHQTLLWHHRLGHPSLPRLRGMASRVLGHEHYFLLVVDDYSRYTTVFPLRSKGDVTEVLIDWIRAARLQLRESFGSDFPVLRLHSDRGGEFSSARLGAFCRAQGIRQTFTLPASPQQNGIAERRIGMVMDVARTSMIHAVKLICYSLCRLKGDVTEVLIDWIRAARLQLRESFGSNFPVLRLHSDRGGEFSSARLGAFCRAQGIRQTFTLPASPQQNGIAERRIGMVMDVARTSMIHAVKLICYSLCRL